MCLTCDVINGKVVAPGGVIYQDEILILHHNLDVAIPGYLIISPVRHISDYGDLTIEEILHLGMMVKQAVSLLYEDKKVEKVYLCSFGEVTKHFHYHIFPKYSWMNSVSAVDTDGKLDAAKLFSKMREARKTPKLHEQRDIITIVKRLRDNFV